MTESKQKCMCRHAKREHNKKGCQHLTDRAQLLVCGCTKFRPQRAKLPRVKTWRGWGVLSRNGKLITWKRRWSAVVTLDESKIGDHLVRVVARLTEMKP